MKHLLFTMLLVFCAIRNQAQISNIKEGFWSDNTVWSNNSLPTNVDDVELNFNIIVDVNATCKSLTLNGNSVTVNAGVNFNVLGSTVTSSDTFKTIYIAGDTGSYFSTSAPAYWKNGNLTVLGTNYHGVVSAIAVADTNVFVLVDSSGIFGDHQTITVWKNGVKNRLGEGEGTSIAVSGNDVYVASSKINSSHTWSDVFYWKNGIALNLGKGISSSIIVSGNDIYIAGSRDSTAIYWKNGSLVMLPDRKLAAGPTAMAVSGKDVFFAATTVGSSRIPVATYWKNGSAVDLENERSTIG